MEQGTILAASGICRRYGSLQALDHVDFDLRAGEIHALLGENGAGKSTLAHILAGLDQPDSGTVRSAIPDAPRPALVQQHFALANDLTVAENLALAVPPEALPSRWWFDPVAAAAPSLSQAERLGWRLDPRAIVGTLPVGVRQRVEIARALSRQAHIVIFDEPTAVLGSAEVDDLFAMLRSLAAGGAGVILIAHKLAEILSVSDRVTVLRRGRPAGTVETKATSAGALAALMMGEAGAPLAPDSPARVDPVGSGGMLQFSGSVADDRGARILDGFTLDAAGGTITGIGGVDGNGQSELAETLAGLRAPAAGQITWNGCPFRPGVAPRIGYIPQDRRRHGLALSMTVGENLCWRMVGKAEFRRGPFLRRGRLAAAAEGLAKQFDIRADSLSQRAGSLSGGNQQKIVLARELSDRPELVICVNPTRGLDIGAARFVHSELRAARQSGASVIVISTDIDEIAALADSAFVISDRTLRPFDPASQVRADVGLLLGGQAAGQ